jgi:hypothetical protein
MATSFVLELKLCDPEAGCSRRHDHLIEARHDWIRPKWTLKIKGSFANVNTVVSSKGFILEIT